LGKYSLYLSGGQWSGLSYAYTNRRANTYPNPNADSGSQPYCDPYTNPNCDCGFESNAHADSDAYSHTDPNPDYCSESNSHAGFWSCSDGEPGARINVYFFERYLSVDRWWRHRLRFNIG
jgi:hypothetical protein